MKNFLTILIDANQTSREDALDNIKIDTILYDREKSHNSDSIFDSKQNRKTLRLSLEDTVSSEIIDTFFEYEELINPYLYYRKNFTAEITELLNYSDQLSQKSIKQIAYFVFQIKNKRMLQILHKIKAGENIDQKLFSLHDSYGLTLFHYALLLNKDEFIIKNKDLISSSLNSSDLPSEIGMFYDYSLLANYLDKKELSNELITSSKELSSLGAKLSILELKLKVKEKEKNYLSDKLSEGKSKLRTAKRTEGFPEDRIDDFDQKIEQIKEKQQELEDEIHDIKTEIRDIDREIHKIKTGILLSQTKFINMLKEHSNTICSFFFHLFNGDYQLESLLTFQGSENNVITIFNKLFYFDPSIFNYDSYEQEVKQGIYNNFGKPFNTNNDYTTETDYEEETDENNEWYEEFFYNAFKPQSESETNYSSIKRLYGNSWFTKDAHQDINILKKEFCKLLNFPTRLIGGIA